MNYGTQCSKTSVWGAVGVVSILLTTGCSPTNSGQNAFRGIERAERFAEGSSGRRIASLGDAAPMTVGGEAVGWEDILPRLGEAAGGLVVEEVALERLLIREVARRGMAVSQDDLDRERLWLAASISGVGVSPASATEADQLIWQIRQRRGLGPVRYESLLRRNAMLRALVRERVEVRPDQVELAWRVQHGERVRVRIIVAPTQHDAQRLRDVVLAGEAASMKLRFAELAQRHSTDSSAPFGGLIEPFSIEDPAYEQTIRQSAALLEPGQTGPIVAIRNGYAVVYLDERLQGDGVSLEHARPALTEQLRQRQERLMMDALASQLLAEARVHVIDPSLLWSVRAGDSR